MRWRTRTTGRELPRGVRRGRRLEKTNKRWDRKLRAGTRDCQQTGECENGRERQQKLPLLLPSVHAPSARGACLPLSLQPQHSCSTAPPPHPTPPHPVAGSVVWVLSGERAPPCLAPPEAVHRLHVCWCLKTSHPGSVKESRIVE